MRKLALVAGLVLWAHVHAYGQIAYLQSANTVSTQTTSGVSASFTSNTTAGDAIVVALGVAGSTVTSVSDTQGNAYVQAVVSGGTAIWYAMGIKGGANTVTANFAGSSGFSTIYIHEYAGLAATGALDQVSSETGTGTAVSSGAKTTTQASELIFGYATVDSRVTAGSSGFTARQTAGGNMSEDMIISAIGTYQATFTQSTSGGWTGLMATFKAGSSTSGSSPQYLQSANAVSTQTSSGVSSSFASSTTAGDAIVAALGVAGSTVTSVSDSQGNAYAQAVASSGASIWYATGIKGGADTVTANFAASSGYSTIYIHEYAGFATSGALDQVSSQTGTGTAVTSGAKTTTQVDELIFGYASVDYRVSGGGTGFTVRQTAGGNMSEDMIASASGTYAATFTQSSSGAWVGLMATFKAGGSGPPPTLESIAVTPANPSITVGSSPLQMTATGTYSNSSTANITSSCAWTSNATGVAPVNSSGQVSGVVTGSASITCKIGTVSGSTTVTVTPGVAAIRYVQSANNVSSQASSGVSASFASNTTAGDAIIVAPAAAGSSAISVTDTQGNIYSQAVASGGASIWYATAIKGGTDTVTANFAGSSGFSVIYVHEYAGLATSGALDQVSSQMGTGTAVNSGAKTTTQTSELLFGYAAVDDYVSAAGAGFTARQTAGGNMSEDMIVSAVGTYATTFTQNNDGGTLGWTGLMATFAAGGSGGGGGTPPTAVIGASATSGTAALAVAFNGSSSSDPDGTITSYAWDFGDGQTSGAESPSHTYMVVGTYTVSLTVTDNAGRQGTATSTITVSAPASYAGVYRIIAGGGPYTDSANHVWQGDAGYNTGDVTTTTAAISGTADAALYQSERWDDPSQAQLEYQLPIANGTYLVNLYFAETDAGSEGVGLRVFGVDFQGVPAIANLDIYGSVGADAALMKTAVVSVSNGVLTIDFVRQVGNPKIDAIEVREVSGQDNELPKKGWTIANTCCVSEEWDVLDGSSLNAIDNDGSTFWLTQITPNGNISTPPGYPEAIQVDLGKSYALSGFQYLPRQDGSTQGMIGQYTFSVSTDGVNWGSPVASGTFSETALQTQVSFAPVNAQYVQLEGVTDVNGNTTTPASMAELGVLFECTTTPSVVITAPVNEYLQSSGASLTATAHACLDPVQNAGWGVQFTLDGGNAIDVYTPPFQATFTNLSKAEHVIDAYVINSSGAVVSATGATHDEVNQIGVGDYYVTMGDSVTWGYGGTTVTSNDGRDTDTGYEPLLNNLLTSSKGYPQEVADEGVPGTTSAEGLEYVSSILAKHPGSQTFLVMFGMNDARPWLPVPSGEGLNPGDSGYAGSYKDNMQQIINQLNAAGKHVALGKTNVALADCADSTPSDPGYCAPYTDLNTGARNVLIQEYNEVVDELVSNTANGITVTPPDFYTFFSSPYPYPSVYYNWIHPNETGYQDMAQLWFQALTQ